MDTLLILVAVVALIAIAWIVLSLLRGRDTASTTTSTTSATSTTGHTGDPVSTAYERELSGPGTYGGRSGRTEPGTEAPAHVENMRTGAAAAGAAVTGAAATMAGAGAAPTAPSSPVSTAYEADLAQSGARSAPAPDARDMAENLRTDVGANDGTVAPRPMTGMGGPMAVAGGNMGSGSAATTGKVIPAPGAPDTAGASDATAMDPNTDSTVAHAGTMGLMTGAGVVASAAADTRRAGGDDSLLTPDVAPGQRSADTPEEEMGEEILRRRAREAQAERDVDEARGLAENFEQSEFAREGRAAAPRRDDAAAEDFIETPLPEPAPTDAAAATGGLGAVTMDEPENMPEDDDRRAGFST